MDKKYHINQRCFKQETSEKYYWLGFLYGDGYTYGNRIKLCLANKDINHLKKYCKFLGNKDRPMYHKKKENADEVQVRFTKAFPILDKFEVSTNKSMRKYNVIQKIPNKFKPDFIRGLFDADGCISIGKRTAIELTGRYNLMEWLLEELIFQNVISEDTKIYKNGSIFRLRFSKNKGIKFLDYIYTNTTIYLDRKFKLYKKL